MRRFVMKKIVALFLSVVMVLSFNMVAFAQNDVDVYHAEDPVAKKVLAEAKRRGAIPEYVFSRTATQYKGDWGYHPQIRTWQVVDGYVLSLGNTVSMSVTLSVGGVSIQVAGESSSGSIEVDVDRSKGASRVKVGGTIAVDLYDIYIYDEMGNLKTVVKEGYKVFNSEASVLNYFAVYKNEVN